MSHDATRLLFLNQYFPPDEAATSQLLGDLTGVPMVLNTSFNDNEPIVCRPEEALDCFLRTQMDALVLGDFLITKS